MLELMDFVTLGVISGGFSLVFAAIFAYGTVLLRDYRVSKVEREVTSLIMARHNDEAQNARAVRGMEKTKAMMELGEILRAKEGDKKEQLMTWASNNPEFVLTLAKKFGVNL